MIKKIEIKNFRGFRNFVCDSLAPVTVIGGKNDCGKSSFLEAIALIASCRSTVVLREITKVRGITLKRLDDMKSLFWGCDTGSTVEIDTTGEQGDRNALKMQFKAPSVSVQPSGEFEPITEQTLITESLSKNRIELSLNGESPVSCFEREGEVAFVIDPTARSVFSGVYLSPRAMIDPVRSVSELKKSGKLDPVLKVIQKIDPRVEEIAPIEDGVWARIAGVAEMIPVQSLGDGLIKTITYVSSLLTVPEKSIIAIDEIENGLHYSAMSVLWSALLEVAQARSQQLFVTTHNLEMLQAISNEMPTPSQDIVYLRLDKRADSSVSCTPYTMASLADHLAIGAEVRG